MASMETDAALRLCSCGCEALLGRVVRCRVGRLVAPSVRLQVVVCVCASRGSEGSPNCQLGRVAATVSGRGGRDGDVCQETRLTGGRSGGSTEPAPL
jgi:hypothetical protein